MASQPIIETKKINGGKWNDLDTYWNVTTTLFFNFPVGAIILVRYGSNISWLGWDTQKQTLDGSAVWKRLSVGGWSRFGATVKIKPLQDSEVTYEQWPGDIVQRIPAAH